MGVGFIFNRWRILCDSRRNSDDAGGAEVIFLQLAETAKCQRVALVGLMYLFIGLCVLDAELWRTINLCVLSAVINAVINANYYLNPDYFINADDNYYANFDAYAFCDGYAHADFHAVFAQRD